MTTYLLMAIGDNDVPSFFKQALCLKVFLLNYAKIASETCYYLANG